MNRRLTAVLGLTAAVVLASASLYVWSNIGLRSLQPSAFSVVRASPRRRVTRTISLFATVQHEREAYRIYRKQQDFEYLALSSALHSDTWQDGLSVEFDSSADPTARFTNRHRLVWDLFSPFYNCPLQERVGTPSILFDGGKWLCGVQQLLKRPTCVVYSFGSNGQLSFEEALIDITNSLCQVHVFDFSLSEQQITHIQNTQGVTFHNYGIGPTDERIVESFVYDDRTIPSYDLKSLPTIMAQLGHTWIDVFKMDIEGGEYKVLSSIVQHYSKAKQVIPITQAQIEYHHHDEEPARQELITTLTQFEKSGFRAFHSEYNYHGEAWNYIEYAYLHVDASGKVVLPPTTDLDRQHVYNKLVKFPKLETGPISS